MINQITAYSDQIWEYFKTSLSVIGFVYLLKDVVLKCLWKFLRSYIPNYIKLYRSKGNVVTVTTKTEVNENLFITGIVKKVHFLSVTIYGHSSTSVSRSDQLIKIHKIVGFRKLERPKDNIVMDIYS